MTSEDFLLSSSLERVSSRKKMVYFLGKIANNLKWILGICP